MLGPVLALLILLAPPPGGLSFEAWALTGLLVLMVVWWVSEAIPIPITSLLPLLFLPLFGIADMRAAAAPYFSPIVVLLLGGFILAKSVERWGLHERLALLTVSRAGSSPGGLSAGFLAAAALLSAWISNTATTIMLMPVALSVAHALGQKRGAGTPLTVALVLSVAYGASIGGLATPIGTPTNLIVLGGLEEMTGRHIGFPQWMTVGVPTVLLLLPAAWLVLNRLSGPVGRPDGDPQRVVRERLAGLGPWTPPEIRTLAVFAIVAVFWVFRRMLFQELELFGLRPFGGLTDAGIAVAGAIAVFLVPSGSREERGSMLLDWPAASRIPWDVLLLFGGGLSLAAAITATGLGAALAAGMAGLEPLPVVVIAFLLTAGVIFATELTSNVATAAALTPVVLALAAGIGTEPVRLALPVALAASCAFMFPMATAPNALAYGSGELSIARMARIGVKLNLLGIVVIVAAAQFLVPRLG
ncbi:SLC13 family permease [Parvularcula oceani]|uniref:SLC13 family permease n=1 Tax=Parvularcula oceani TaxID=1247963 RepID=UPI000A9AE0B8|nr:DASS family sodium-coupled anion symporter [Parvularcula oceani]